MKKKRQRQQNCYSSPVVDLKSLIQQHALFFDKLAELIPAKYSSAGNAKEERVGPAYISGDARENQLTLNAENASVSVPETLMSNLEQETTDVTYEELQRRLRNKMGEIHSGQRSGDLGKEEETAGRTGKTIPQKKRAREPPELVEVRPNAESPLVEEVNDVEQAARELQFSRVKMESRGEEGKCRQQHRRRKEVMLKELERARKLEAAKKDPGKGDGTVKQLSWEAAASRAAGTKVYDRPSVLEKKLKMEKKLCQKKAEKWRVRIEAQEKMKEEKQKKRLQNITDRITQKKMRRIAKREKKLLRPGFEGRKEGYINEQ